VVFIVAAAAGVGAYLLVRDQTSNPTNSSSNGLPPASAATVSATSFDPPPGDGSEDSSAVANVLDHDPTTVWSTDFYEDFSRLKPGVGLVLNLDPTSSLSAVTVSTAQAGWSAAIYTTTEDGSTFTTIDDWGQPVASGDNLGVSHRFGIEPAQRTRFVLVWFTALPDGSDGRQHLDVSEIELA